MDNIFLGTRWDSRGVGGKNGVGILVDRDLRELVVDVRRCLCALSGIERGGQKVLLGGFGQGCTRYPAVREDFHMGDFNCHVGETARGYDEVHGSIDFGVRNEVGTSLLDFAKPFDLVLANTGFQKRKEQLVTFRSRVAKIQID
uniref:Uncharacterized protein LOC104238942 n=1 Tax=Nicotiana sylvestris TaxID=4096 RepID=A0A1U7XI75_NICSY|nr:PREDICTED: uncharacterized protein LOC104238942 [Nicotiana sylvestris]